MSGVARALLAAPSWQALDHPVILADCLDALRALPEASVDAVVTDPPYGLEFMGAEWDAPWKTGDGFRRQRNAADAGRTNVFGRTSRRGPEYVAGIGFQQWVEAWASEALRVLKPGGHMAVFGSTRTYHRLAAGIEDAGFEIRDTLAWLFGSGFPKSLDVSKAIDRARDDRAEVVRVTAALGAAAARAGISRAAIDAHMGTSDMAGWWTSTLQHRCACPTWTQWGQLADFVGLDGTDRADLDAEVWRLNGRKGAPGEAWAQREVVGVGYRVDRHDGAVPYGTGTPEGYYDITAPASAVSSAWEGWGTALKPAFEPIVLARKPLAGTVAANVLAHGTGALHIDACRIEGRERTDYGLDSATRTRGSTYGAPSGSADFDATLGRWPANVLLDETAAAALDEQSGARPSGARAAGVRKGLGYHGADGDGGPAIEASTGGASRFFYVAKASRGERDAGLDGFPLGELRWSSGEQTPGTFQSAGTDRTARNHHPTVKPIELMRWLLRLLTPPDGIVLDLFAGSGTTVCAGVMEGTDVIGIEREPAYVEIARARAAWWAEHPSGVPVDVGIRAGRARKRRSADGQISILENAPEERAA